MLHFFSGIERSEEEKGDGAVRVFAEIRQIDQFPTRRAAPEYGGYVDYSQSRPSPARKPQPRFTGSSVGTSAGVAMLELNAGDMIRHAAFGRGMVLSVMKMGGDALLEIAFDDIGTKKLMAKTASAHMKKL